MQLTLIPREGNQNWLDNFINQINALITKPDNKKKKSIHEKLKKLAKNDLMFEQVIDKKTIRNNHPLENVTVLRKNLDQFLVKSIIIKYLECLNEKGLYPDDDLKIAFDFYGRGILVWIETPEEELEIESACKEIEQQINECYKPHDIKMSTNIFDSSYGFPFPPKYI